MRKHKTLKAFGATALAAATVASGLSFGATAASAAPEARTPSAPFKFVWQEGDRFSSLDSYATEMISESLSEAERRAADFTYDAETMRVTNTGGQCLGVGTFGANYLRAEACSTSPLQKFLFTNGSFATATTPLKYLNTEGSHSGRPWMNSDTPTPLIGGPESAVNGGFESAPGYTYEVEAGKTVGVSVPVEATADSTLSDGMVFLTAPTGTKFTAGQTVAKGRIAENNVWVDHPTMDAKGSVSADGTKFTGQITAGAKASANRYYSWRIYVTADAIPADTTSPVQQSFVGVTNVGRFLVNGTSTVTVKASKNEFTAVGAFADDVTKKATISGTGVDGSTMKLYAPNGDEIDSQAVSDGKYSFSVTAPGSGVQTFKVSQTTDGVESPQKDAGLDYGNAVAITGPATGSVTPGDVTVTGTGVSGSKVTITGGAKTVTTTVGTDNTFSAPVEIAPSSSITNITVSQQSKGNLTTTAAVKVTADGKQEATGTAITGPADGVYEPMKTTTVTGTATPYAKVVITNQWNVSIATVTADKDGTWSFDRVYGPAAEYQLTATQTRLDGSGSKSAAFALAPLGSFKNLTIDNEAPATYTAGKDYTFTGTATPGATITATNQWGTKVFETRANQSNGTWTSARQYGPTAEYTLTFVQKALDGKTDKREGFVLKPLVTETPMTITSHKDGDSYRPGSNTFTGVGTPGATVTARNQWNTVMGSATVKENGDWAFERTMGPSAPYTLTFTQTKDGKTINTVPLNLAAPVVQDFALTSPAAGETYTPMKATTFTGKASAFSKITVTTTLGTKVFETEADQKGDWSYTRAYGPTNTYTLNFDETTTNGTTTRVLQNFIFAPDAPATK
ncbi:Ig-like domain-containing protein [Curtobacterium sp. PhB136]|uniref:Ig-like domain-containing protein n=1 Tax=Curtobacterium sp. PhB136 TaxID=2485181 RepID=UPI001053F6DC|nr:Ig-like domain-containing protein [Curtobacterium sp. PhB136]TCK65419.1 hypothetical protein EDF27_0157 [Curtobacterium sp. PhB136]